MAVEAAAPSAKTRITGGKRRSARRRALVGAYYAFVCLVIVSPFLMIGFSVFMLMQLAPTAK